MKANYYHSNFHILFLVHKAILNAFFYPTQTPPGVFQRRVQLVRSDVISSVINWRAAPRHRK